MKSFKIHFRKRDEDGLHDIIEIIECLSKKKAIEYGKSKESESEKFYFIGLIK